MTAVPATRVVCLVFDSPGQGFLTAGMEAGRLPNLARLLNQGRAFSIADHQEIATPASWPTLIRGCDVPDHKLSSDRARVPGEYRIVDVQPEDAARPPFWRYISDAGIQSVILGAYSATILDRFHGLQISGWGSHDPFDAKLGRIRSDPPRLLSELDHYVGKRALGYDRDPPRGTRRVRRYVQDMVRGCDQQARALIRLMGSIDWGFAFASFGEGHQAGHWLWHLTDPSQPDYDPRLPADVRDGLIRIYEATDRAIGNVLATLPQDVVVLIVSPYDMGPNHHLDEAFPLILERGGWLVPRPLAQSGTRLRALATGRRVIRAAVPATARPALGRLAGRDRLLAELALGTIDWPSTTAMPTPSDGSSGVRLNLVGRERDGCVKRGLDADRVLQDITEALLELRCADTGKPVVARVARYEEVYDAPALSGAMDLLVQWRRITRPRAVHSEQLGEIPVPKEHSRRSVHYSPGFVLGVGPGLTPSRGRSLTGDGQGRLADVGASVLALLGVPLPPAVTGRPIPGLVPAVAEPAV